MFNMFNPQTSQSPAIELIPSGTLSHALLEIKEVKTSQSSGGKYANCKVTLVGGQFERRVVFTMIPDPTDENNSEKWRQSGVAALQHILEATGLFDPAKPETYGRFGNATFGEILTAIDGKQVAVKIKIEKGKDGYDDKNAVSDFLSPNPVSRTNRDWVKLHQQAAAPQASPQPSFGGAPAPTAMPGFLAAGQNKPPF